MSPLSCPPKRCFKAREGPFWGRIPNSDEMLVGSDPRDRYLRSVSDAGASVYSVFFFKGFSGVAHAFGEVYAPVYRLHNVFHDKRPEWVYGFCPGLCG